MVAEKGERDPVRTDNVFVSNLICERELSEVLKETGAGLESIQFSISDNLDHLEDTLCREKRMLDRLGNPELILHGPFLDLNPACFDSLVRRATKKRFDQAYRAAQELGAKKIVFHSGMIPTVYFTEGWAKRAAAFWEEFLEEKSGITVCMENVLDKEIWPVAEVAKQVRHPDFGLCLDIGHAHCYAKESALEWAKQLKEWIRHVHVHDNDGGKDAHRALGDGAVPYREIVKLLDDGVSERTWTIECSTKADILQSYVSLTKFR